MDAIAFGLLAGVLFGALTVAVRWGLLRGGDAALGTAVITATAFLTASAIALPSAISGVDAGELWRFAVIGLAVPGASQIVFVLSVRYAGPARAAIAIGSAPLLSVVLAVALLDEPLRPAVIASTALIVAGGAALVADPGRPPGYRSLGIVLALVCAALFALRDNAVRWVARDVDPEPLQATAASLLAAAIVAALYVVARRGGGRTRRNLRPSVRAFVPAGVLLALAYAALVSGFDRGRVGIVAPLNATQSLWAVVFAALVYGRSEAIGRRTVLAGLLVVAGGVIIGVFR